MDFDVWEKQNVSNLLVLIWFVDNKIDLFSISVIYSELFLEVSEKLCLQTEEQAQEVQTGLWLLNMAISSLGASITNSALHSHIEASIRNIASLKQVLRSLSIQVSPIVMRDEIGNHVVHSVHRRVTERRFVGSSTLVLVYVRLCVGDNMNKRAGSQHINEFEILIRMFVEDTQNHSIPGKD